MRTAIAAMALAVTVASAHGHEVASVPPVDALVVRDPVDWRIAQVRIARAGAAALPDLDVLCASAFVGQRERIRATVGLMLLKSIDEGDLRGHERLLALCRDDLARARTLTAELLHAEHYDNGSPHLDPAPLPQRTALAAAIALGGFAVPAAVDLCHAPTPAARMYGLELLRELDATSQRRLIEKMAADGGRILMRDGCEAYPTTVGAIAEHVRFSSWPFMTCARDEARPPYRAEAREYVLWLDRGTDERLHEALIAAGVRDAASWDDYWRRARPALATVLAEERGAAGTAAAAAD